MKKIIYSISLLTLVSFSSKAQSKSEDVKTAPSATAETVVKQEDNSQVDPKQEKKDEKKETKGGGTRMAINQKGVPTSKSSAANKDAKEDKNTGTKAPAKTDEKH